MRKDRIKIFLIVFIGIVLVSCKKEVSMLSKKTTFTDIVLNGDSIVFLTTSESYQEAGATSDDGSVVSILGDVNTNVPGESLVTYKAINKDGFESVKTRKIIVLNTLYSGKDISGKYTGSWNTSTYTTTMEIKKIREGVFYINDLMAGRYGYPNLAPAFIYYLGPTSLDVAYMNTPPFGEVFVNGFIDAGNSIISYKLYTTSYDFLGKEFKLNPK